MPATALIQTREGNDHRAGDVDTLRHGDRPWSELTTAPALTREQGPRPVAGYFLVVDLVNPRVRVRLFPPATTAVSK